MGTESVGTEPPEDQRVDPGQRWTGRARVSSPGPPAQPESGSVSPPAKPGSVYPGTTPRTSPQPAASVYRGRKARPRWRFRRVLATSLIVVTVLSVVAILGGFVFLRNVDHGLKRTPAFGAEADRPLKIVDGAQNILLLGSDSRDPEASADGAGRWRTDTIVLMHIPADARHAYLISIPRDTWVHLPESGSTSAGMGKINAAYARGGAALMVATVEQFTGVYIDHVVLIDFGGFVQVTDALGGVDMYVEQTIKSIHPPYRTFPAGWQHLDGEQALDYVRQRYQFSDGDFARIRHQQAYLKALAAKAVSLGTVTNLASLVKFVTSVANAMTVDQDFSLVQMLWQLRGIRAEDLQFLTSPVSGVDTIDGQSVVVSDRTTASALYTAVANDTLAQWLARYPPD